VVQRDRPELEAVACQRECPLAEHAVADNVISILSSRGVNVKGRS
jgi:hypothetical protein